MNRISTLIPTHNSLRFLKLCVKSFRKYSLPDNRLIVHVDGSIDGTREWLQNEGVEHTYDEWKGIPHAVNTLAKKSDSEFIGFINDDVVFSPDWDKNVLSWLKDDVIICPDLLEAQMSDFGKTPEEFNEEAFVKYVEEKSEHRLEPKHWGLWFMKRELFFKNGLHDLNYKPYGMEDIDFYMRLKKNFPDVRIYVAHDFILYHFVAGSKSKVEGGWAKIGPRIDAYFKKKWEMGTGEATKILREWVRR